MIIVNWTAGKAENCRLDVRQCTREDQALLVTICEIVSKKLDTTVRNEAEKNMELAQKWYKIHEDRNVRFTVIVKEGVEFSLTRSSLFRSAA